MSYRHSNYRKLKRARRNASSGRTYPLRVAHWAGLVFTNKPFGWGKPKGWRA